MTFIESVHNSECTIGQRPGSGASSSVSGQRPGSGASSSVSGQRPGSGTSSMVESVTSGVVSNDPVYRAVERILNNKQGSSREYPVADIIAAAMKKMYGDKAFESLHYQYTKSVLLAQATELSGKYGVGVIGEAFAMDQLVLCMAPDEHRPDGFHEFTHTQIRAGEFMAHVGALSLQHFIHPVLHLLAKMMKSEQLTDLSKHCDEALTQYCTEKMVTSGSLYDALWHCWQIDVDAPVHGEVREVFPPCFNGGSVFPEGAPVFGGQTGDASTSPARSGSHGFTAMIKTPTSKAEWMRHKIDLNTAKAETNLNYQLHKDEERKAECENRDQKIEANRQKRREEQETERKRNKLRKVRDQKRRLDDEESLLSEQLREQ